MKYFYFYPNNLG